MDHIRAKEAVFLYHKQEKHSTLLLNDFNHPDPVSRFQQTLASRIRNPAIADGL